MYFSKKKIYVSNFQNHFKTLKQMYKKEKVTEHNAYIIVERETYQVRYLFKLYKDATQLEMKGLADKRQHIASLTS